MTQKDKIRHLTETIAEIQQETESGHCPLETLIERAAEEDLGPNQVEHYVGKLKERGVVYEPATDALKYVGGA